MYIATLDPEIKLDSRTGIFYFRGTVVRGGKEIKRSLGVKNFRSAQLAKKELLLKLRGISGDSKNVLFKDYLKVFFEERKRRAPRTFELAHYSCQELARFFNSYFIHQITDRSWDEYVEYMHQIKPNRLLKYDRRHLKMMLLRCKKKGLISEVPELQITERAPKIRRALTKVELDLILKNATGTMYGLALFMIKMGARPGEVLGAQWDEFDLDKGLWVIPAERVKTRKSRAIKLNDKVRLYLSSKKRISDYVFPTKENIEQPIHRYNKQWKRLMTKCGLSTDITPYYLRHTFLTECAKKIRDGKLGLVYVAKYAGTSLNEFERTYLHIEGEDTKDVAQLMD